MKCWLCNGTGKTEIPKNEEFDREFDRIFWMLQEHYLWKNAEKGH